MCRWLPAGKWGRDRLVSAGGVYCQWDRWLTWVESRVRILEKNNYEHGILAYWTKMGFPRDTYTDRTQPIKAIYWIGGHCGCL